MALRKLIILSLLLFPLSLGAETASDYVHRGAQKYIFGHEEAAEVEVKEGLEKFPEDRELRDMLALFKKKPPQDEQNNKKDEKQNENQQQENSSSSQGKDHEKNQTSTPTPTPGEDQNPNGRGQSPTPTVTPGSSPPFSPTPGANGENGDEQGEHPTPSPFATSNKPLTGEVKGAGEQKPEGTPNGELAEAEPEKEGEMSAKQALALLESMKDEEEKVQLDEHKAVRPVYRDW